MALFIALATVAWADSPWFRVVWQADDGLPGDNVTGLAQTRDGYLWIATQSGLAHFDGVRIQSVPLSVGRSHPIIRSMVMDARDRLWLGLEGGSVVSFSPEQTLMFTTTNGLARSQPLEIAQGSNSVWVSYLDGSVCRIADGAITRFTEANGLTGAGTCSLASDAQGQLWFAQGGQVGVFREERFVPSFATNERYTHLEAARDRGLWICAGDKLLRTRPGAAPVEVGKIPADVAVVRPTAMLEDGSGAVWIGTASSGLFRYDGNKIVAVETSHGRIRSVTEDREGNIWVGTDGGGLNRLRPQVVEVQGRDAGLPFDTVRSLCEDTNGSLWVVMENGDVTRNEGGVWKTISADAAWPGGQATCVACDPSGVVWFGTYSRGVYRWENGRFSVLRRRDGLVSSSVRCLLADRAGNLWITYAAAETVQRLRDGKFQDFALPAGSRAVRAMAESADGTIWLANLDAQLFRVRQDVLVDETALTAEPFRPIRCLSGTPDGSLWIGYSVSGVGRLKGGKFERIGVHEGLKDGSICSLVSDGRGWFWFGSDHGIFRVSEQELQNVADGKATHVKSFGYGKDDGLPSLQGNYGHTPAATRTADGRVLLPTKSGVAIIHADRVQTNRIAPRAIIESVAVDNQMVSLGSSSKPLSLRPDHHKVQVAYTAPSFIEPEKVRFRYRLEGLDEDWVNADHERSAVYSRLPAGDYQFRVLAANNANVWSEAAATFSFTVEPFFWQRWWFRLGSVVLFVAAIVMLARYFSFKRLRVQLQRLEEENALQRERARIAQDIHDDFGARMTQISLLAELTHKAMGRPQEAGEHVEQIATMSRQGIKALDEIVWAVNPRNDTLADLLDFAGQYAVDFLRVANIRCRIDFPNPPPSGHLSAELRHSLFLAIKESLNNVVKHAQASEVWLRVQVVDDALRWTLEDNGRGFDQLPENATADGLRNLRARLGEFGGYCTIKTRPGAGVQVCFQVPWRGD